MQFQDTLDASEVKVKALRDDTNDGIDKFTREIKKSASELKRYKDKLQEDVNGKLSKVCDFAIDSVCRGG